MALKIKVLTPLAAQDVASGAPAKAAPIQNSRPQNSSEDVGSSDKVSLTTTSVRLQCLEHALTNPPAVDTQRVEAVAKSISDGTYEVNAGRLAGKLFGLEGVLHSKA
jgi:flagellar biosynthesis anti-sigma factor FlgM